MNIICQALCIQIHSCHLHPHAYILSFEYSFSLSLFSRRRHEEKVGSYSRLRKCARIPLSQVQMRSVYYMYVHWTWRSMCTTYRRSSFSLLSFSALMNTNEESRGGFVSAALLLSLSHAATFAPPSPTFLCLSSSDILIAEGKSLPASQLLSSRSSYRHE